MFHFLLFASVHLASPEAQDRLSVRLKYDYPARPPKSIFDPGWAAFVERWGPYPPWENVPVWGGQEAVDSERWDGTVVAVSRKGIEIRVKGEDKTLKYPPHYLLASGRVIPWVTDGEC